MNNQAAQTMHPDALPDGTLSKSTAKRLAAASVSERARALMAQAYRDGGFPRAAGILEAGVIDSVDSCALRALEQALTQQRGECWPLNKNPKDGWTFDPSFLDEVKTRAEQSDIGEFAPCLEGVESVLIALRGMGDTTPQPSADAVRELVKRWRGYGKDCGVSQVWGKCADELESLLSAASGEKGVG